VTGQDDDDAEESQDGMDDDGDDEPGSGGEADDAEDEDTSAQGTQSGTADLAQPAEPTWLSENWRSFLSEESLADLRNQAEQWLTSNPDVPDSAYDRLDEASELVGRVLDRVSQLDRFEFNEAFRVAEQTSGPADHVSAGVEWAGFESGGLHQGFDAFADLAGWDGFDGWDWQQPGSGAAAGLGHSADDLWT
jgi:hypothetical protein